MLAVHCALYCHVRASTPPRASHALLFRLAAGMSGVEHVLLGVTRRHAPHVFIAVAVSGVVCNRYSSRHVVPVVWAVTASRLLLLGASRRQGTGLDPETAQNIGLIDRNSLISGLAMLTASVLVELAVSEFSHGGEGGGYGPWSQRSTDPCGQAKCFRSSRARGDGSDDRVTLDHSLTHGAVKQRRPCQGKGGERGGSIHIGGGVANGIGFVNGRRTSLPVLTEKVCFYRVIVY